MNINFRNRLDEYYEFCDRQKLEAQRQNTLMKVNMLANSRNINNVKNNNDLQIPPKVVLYTSNNLITNNPSQEIKEANPLSFSQQNPIISMSMTQNIDKEKPSKEAGISEKSNESIYNESMEKNNSRRISKIKLNKGQKDDNNKINDSKINNSRKSNNQKIEVEIKNKENITEKELINYSVDFKNISKVEENIKLTDKPYESFIDEDIGMVDKNMINIDVNIQKKASIRNDNKNNSLDEVYKKTDEEIQDEVKEVDNDYINSPRHCNKLKKPSMAEININQIEKDQSDIIKENIDTDPLLKMKVEVSIGNKSKENSQVLKELSKAEPQNISANADINLNYNNSNVKENNENGEQIDNDSYFEVGEELNQNNNKENQINNNIESEPNILLNKSEVDVEEGNKANTFNSEVNNSEYSPSKILSSAKAIIELKYNNNLNNSKLSKASKASKNVNQNKSNHNISNAIDSQNLSHFENNNEVKNHSVVSNHNDSKIKDLSKSNLVDISTEENKKIKAEITSFVEGLLNHYGQIEYVNTNERQPHPNELHLNNKAHLSHESANNLFKNYESPEAGKEQITNFISDIIEQKPELIPVKSFVSIKVKHNEDNDNLNKSLSIVDNLQYRSQEEANNNYEVLENVQVEEKGEMSINKSYHSKSNMNSEVRPEIKEKIRNFVENLLSKEVGPPTNKILLQVDYVKRHSKTAEAKDNEKYECNENEHPNTRRLSITSETVKEIKEEIRNFVENLLSKEVGPPTNKGLFQVDYVKRHSKTAEAKYNEEYECNENEHPNTRRLSITSDNGKIKEEISNFVDSLFEVQNAKIYIPIGGNENENREFNSNHKEVQEIKDKIENYIEQISEVKHEIYNNSKIIDNNASINKSNIDELDGNLAKKSVILTGKNIQNYSEANLKSENIIREKITNFVDSLFNKEIVYTNKNATEPNNPANENEDEKIYFKEELKILEGEELKVKLKEFVGEILLSEQDKVPFSNEPDRVVDEVKDNETPFPMNDNDHNNVKNTDNEQIAAEIKSNISNFVDDLFKKHNEVINYKEII